MEAVPSGALAAAYRDFSASARGRSPLYEMLAGQVAQDCALLERIARLPYAKRQPNLFFGAMKYLFGVMSNGAQFRDRAHDEWEAVQSVMLTRRTQTNEPARCAPLLLVLAGLRQPLALLEVGASAGLCLLPDYYAYDYGSQRIGASILTPSPPLFHCAASANTPLPKQNVEVVWRAGVDLNPLNCRDPDTVRWLKALVWPGEGERETKLEQALAVASAAPPRLEQGDLREAVVDLAAEAPQGVTLVIFHSAVLNYIAATEERVAFAQTVRATGAQWIAQEDPDIFSDDNRRSWPKGVFFRLSLNGKTLARTESHGATVEWLDGSAGFGPPE